jgi:hypothetical protein
MNDSGAATALLELDEKQWSRDYGTADTDYITKGTEVSLPLPISHPICHTTVHLSPRYPLLRILPSTASSALVNRISYRGDTHHPPDVFFAFRVYPPH